MIEQLHKAEPKTAIQKFCQLLDLPISSYYYKTVERPEDLELKEKMQEIFTQTFNTYGKRPKKPHYYPVGQELPNIANLLNREFNPVTLHTHWVGDVTYIRSHQGWNYLATVMDLGNKELGNKEIVGYAHSTIPDAQLAKEALTNAISKHQVQTKGLLFHSDQGVQYTAKLFKETLAIHQIKQSMSRRGCCWDNAVQERFFRNLKTEYLNDITFMNHRAVVDAIEKYIRFYNYKRLNSAIDYLTPVQKRLELLKVA